MTHTTPTVSYSSYMSTTYPNPSSYITKGKQRIKQFGSKVYLKDKDNFEIELFNPTTGTILAKIKLNGKYASNSGIVLRPGERVFLERYLDSNNKFEFSTYEVSKGVEAQNAIRNNGLVEVEFYSEKRITPPLTLHPYWYSNSGTLSTNTALYSSSGTANYLNGTTFTTSTNTNGTFTLTSAVSGTNPLRGMPVNNKVETGTVKKGEESAQKFQQVSEEFEHIAFTIQSWQILPASTKPVTAQEATTIYCTECGTKRKKDTFKFCPQCGTKF